MPTGVYKHKKGYKRPKEVGEKISRSKIGYKHSDEAKKRISLGHKGQKSWNKGKKTSDESKEKMRQAKLGKKASKKTKAKMSLARKGRKLTQEWKNKISKAHLGKKQSEEHRRKNSEAKKGSKHPFWLGGISQNPYPVDWTNTLRISIRERDKYTCQICGEKQGDTCHHVHHIDYNKDNCDVKNLITLCNSCHVKTNFNRDYWREYFINTEYLKD